jgi:hypothetical protein
MASSGQRRARKRDMYEAGITEGAGRWQREAVVALEDPAKDYAAVSKLWRRKLKPPHGCGWVLCRPPLADWGFVPGSLADYRSLVVKHGVEGCDWFNDWAGLRKAWAEMGTSGILKYRPAPSAQLLAAHDKKLKARQKKPAAPAAAAAVHMPGAGAAAAVHMPGAGAAAAVQTPAAAAPAAANDANLHDGAARGNTSGLRQELLAWFSSLKLGKKSRSICVTMFEEGVEEIDDLRLVTDEFLQEVGIKLLQRRVIMQGIRTLSVHDKKWSP